jgi:thiol-disulfide isomerase/thioredoxin
VAPELVLPIRLRVLSLSLVGSLACAHANPFPDVDLSRYELPSVDGDAVALGAQRGRVVVIGFFATWCFPCVAESELMQKLHDRYPNSLVVLGVGLDMEGTDALRLYRDQMRLTYPILIADTATREGQSPFGRIAVLPTTFILDKTGKVRDGFVGLAPPDDLDALVNKLANE